MPVIPAGSLLYLSHGEHSLRDELGIFRAAVDLDVPKLWEEFAAGRTYLDLLNKEGVFACWIIRQGLIQPVEFWDAFIDYGPKGIAAWNRRLTGRDDKGLALLP